MYVTLVACPADQAAPLSRRLVESRLAVVLASLEGARSLVRNGQRIEEAASTVLVLLTEKSRLADLAAEAALTIAPGQPPMPIAAFAEWGGLTAFLAQAEERLAADGGREA